MEQLYEALQIIVSSPFYKQFRQSTFTCRHNSVDEMLVRALQSFSRNISIINSYVYRICRTLHLEYFDENNRQFLPLRLLGHFILKINPHANKLSIKVSNSLHSLSLSLYIYIMVVKTYHIQFPPLICLASFHFSMFLSLAYILRIRFSFWDSWAIKLAVEGLSSKTTS